MTSLLLLSLAAVAGPITVEAVEAAATADTLTVEVSTSDVVAREAVSAKLEDGRLHIYLDKAKLRPDRQVFTTADRKITGLPRATYAKLEVPLGGVTCHYPIALETTPAGVRARVTCDPAGATPGAEARAALAAPPEAAGAAAGRRPPVAPPAAEIRPAAPATGERLRKALALPSEPPAPAPAPAETVAPAPGTGAAATADAPAPARSAAAPAVAVPATAATPTTSGISVTLPALALLGLAIAAYVLGKRRARRQGMIRILETAQLGPKRALVVATVNGETLILGSSEAGITLLRGTAPGAAEAGANAPTAAASAPAPADDVQVDLPAPDPEPTAAAPESVDRGADQAGYLSRLFKRPSPDDAGPAAARFDDIFKESLEDQELRRRLNLGLTGKVS